MAGLFPLDKVSIIKQGGEVVGFRVNGKEFYAEETGWADAQVSELKGFNTSSIPRGIWLRPLDGNLIVLEGGISRNGKGRGVANMDVHVYRKYWDHKFGAGQYFEAMKEALAIRKRTNHDVEFIELEDDGAHLSFRYEILLHEDMPVDKALQRFKEIVQEIEGHTERILEKAEISPRVLRDEETYTNEVLLPLFRAMGFNDVHYNHGKREFGKDITFSEIDKFGVRRNYGVQVKAGDLSGEVQSDLDKIIAQIDDAFTIPFLEVTSREQRYISNLIIAVSGRFTDNAKDKIMAKVAVRTVYFFDIEKVEELLTKYMKRQLRK